MNQKESEHTDDEEMSLVQTTKKMQSDFKELLGRLLHTYAHDIIYNDLS